MLVGRLELFTALILFTPISGEITRLMPAEFAEPLLRCLS